MVKTASEGATLVWLRRDLRLEDHHPLWAATHKSAKVYLVFVYDATILGALSDPTDARLAFITATLEALSHQLGSRKQALQVVHGQPVDLIPQLAKDLGVDRVVAGEDYEPLAQKRDQAVEKALGNLGIGFFLFKDQVIFHKDEVLNQSHQPFKVFTPYKKAWLSRLAVEPLKKYKPKLDRLTAWPKKMQKAWPTHPQLGFESLPSPEAPGRDGARARLKKFLKVMDDYHLNRDFPAIDGCSSLAIHLRFGTISIRELVNQATLKVSEGREVWLSELIWREFYKAVLYWFPHVVKGCFKPKFDAIRWPGTKKAFEKWKGGETGYPLIDAAMREFALTGRMHNRLRMIVAHFLVKDLHVDWRLGEQYFAEKLLDFDLSANNGGWQWSASVGCDAQPYFRIFNPAAQSKRFDPDGAYIKAQIPALADVPPSVIHDPLTLAPHRPAAYPPPMVDHKAMRLETLELFKSIG